METVKLIYNNEQVEFQPVANENVMVNATQMAKIFNKDLFQFTKSDATKDFIKSCLKPANAGLLSVKTEDNLIISKQKSGTWMHRVLALKFAAWLDPDFEVWVFYTIDKLINQYFREQRDAMIEKLRIKAKKEHVKNRLIADHPEFIEYFELEEQEKGATVKRINAVKEQLKQLKIDFTDADIDDE